MNQDEEREATALEEQQGMEHAMLMTRIALIALWSARILLIIGAIIAGLMKNGDVAGCCTGACVFSFFAFND